MNTQSKLMTSRELADYFSVNRRTIWRWRTDGWIPYRKLGQKIYRYDLKEVLKALPNYHARDPEEPT